MSRWAEPYTLAAGRIEDPEALVRVLVEENQSLGLRAEATAQSLRGETLSESWRLAKNGKKGRGSATACQS